MVRRRLDPQVVARTPFERWNAFVDLLAMEEFDALTPVQRVAHLAFWYDSEIQNGGHLQYFLNDAGRRAQDAVAALASIGGTCQAEILAAALDRWRKAERRAPETMEQYVALARQTQFDDFDLGYTSCHPTVIELLEQYLDQHENEFLEYEEGEPR